MIPVGTVPGPSSGRIRNTPGISCSKAGMEGELCPSRGRIHGHQKGVDKVKQAWIRVLAGE